MILVSSRIHGNIGSVSRMHHFELSGSSDDLQLEDSRRGGAVDIINQQMVAIVTGDQRRDPFLVIFI